MLSGKHQTTKPRPKVNSPLLGNKHILSVHLLAIIIRVHLVGAVEKWEDKKWGEDRKDLIFSYLYLVGMMKMWRDRKLICLVEKKNERMEK